MLSMFGLWRNRKQIRPLVMPNRRGLAFERLETRAVLSAFSLASYDDGIGNWNLNLNLSQPPNPPANGYTDYSGIAYSSVSDSVFIPDNEDEKIFEYSRNGVYLRTINMTGFTDLEGIYHLEGTRFAVVEESGFPPGATTESFHLSVFSMPAGAGATVDKAPLLSTPTLPTQGTIVFSHPLLNDDNAGGSNLGLEAVAFDATGFFYVAKEDGPMRIFRVPHTGGVTQEVVIPLLTGVNAGILMDISDLFFVRNTDYPNGRLFIMSDDSTKIVMADLDASGLNGTVVNGAGGTPIQVGLPQQSFEGLGFTPDSFEMYATADDEVTSSLRRLLQFRNFTVFNPPATNLADGSDTGVLNNDDITSVTTPTFNGTLTRTLATGTVPVENASVWLYVDGVRVGTVVSTNATGLYSITAPTLAPGPRVIQIRVSETGTFDDTKTSPLSPPLTVTVDTQGPQVTGVSVWNTYGTHAAYGIPAVEGQPDQLRSVQIGGGINQFSVNFSEEIMGPDATIQGAFSLYDFDTAASFSVSAFNSSTATWTISANAKKNRLVLELAAANLLDRAGNLLDGHWVNPPGINMPGSAMSYPSGGNVNFPNEDFMFDIAALRSDVLTDGVVDRADLTVIVQYYGITQGAEYWQGDVDGDGDVDLYDWSRWGQDNGTSLLGYWHGDSGMMMSGGGEEENESLLSKPKLEPIDEALLAAVDLYFQATTSGDAKLFSELRSRVGELKDSGNSLNPRILDDLLADVEVWA